MDRTERGTGQGKVKAPPGTKVVSVKRTSAQDFDPLGDDDEHADQAFLAVDKDPGTSWTTESYSGATLAGKKGVGLYVDAAPGVAATSIEIDTPKPGWQAEIHVAPDGDAPNGAPGEGTAAGSRSAAARSGASASASRCAPTARPTATTSSGSRSCPPAPSASRSPTSRCSAAPS